MPIYIIMRGVFAKLNNPANEAPTLKKDTSVADSDYQSTLIKLVSDSKMRLQELKRRTSIEAMPSPLPLIEEEQGSTEQGSTEPPSLPQIKKRAPRPAVAK